MKTKNTPTKAAKIIAISLLLCSLGNVYGSETGLFYKHKDPWSLITKVYAENGKDTTNLSILDTLDFVMHTKIKIEMNKAYKIKEPPRLGYQLSIGDFICRYMEVAYADKKKEKYDYYKIQYSPNKDSIQSFLKKYPNSANNEELKAKIECLEKIKKWRIAGTYLAKYYHGKQETDYICNAVGYKALANEINFRWRAVDDWLKVSKNNNTNGSNCSVWEDYISRYKGFSPFTSSANDSSVLCRKQMEWNLAVNTGTVQSYERYLKEYPTGARAIKARKKIEDMKAWEKVRNNRTYENMCQYYKDFPEGDSADIALAFIKKVEEAAWNEAVNAASKKKKSTEPYDKFIKDYPNGYYSNEARNKRNELIFDRYNDNSAESIKDLEVAGNYSREGYSLICFGNISKGSDDITVHMIGATSISETIPARKNKWVEVRNGKYKIFVTSSNGSKWNGHGTINVNNRIYCGAWYSYTTTTWNGITIPDFGLQYDSEAVSDFRKLLIDKAASENKIIKEMLAE